MKNLLPIYLKSIPPAIHPSLSVISCQLSVIMQPHQPKMTNFEANQILQWLKEGKTYKTGHYHYGYMFYSYDKEQQKVKIHQQDLSVDIFNPTETTEFVSEEVYIQQLMQYEKFEDIKNRLS